MQETLKSGFLVPELGPDENPKTLNRCLLWEKELGDEGNGDVQTS